uniref:LAGLIDADG endonuclease n=1 Tax=Powellomyces hirtus TaxID=109895 RepID=A0A4P8NQX1_9FUNG|nr:LAGLIDADG endonuclease [Powellomyces hirtus]
MMEYLYETNFNLILLFIYSNFSFFNWLYKKILFLARLPASMFAQEWIIRSERIMISWFNRVNRVYQQEILVSLIVLIQICLSGIKDPISTKSSSETTRNSTFNFEPYRKIKPSHKSNICPNFLTWFIGFVEGDGSFINGKQGPSFELCQNIRDLDLLYYIRTTLGFGIVRTRPEEHRKVGAYYISDKENLERIIAIFNGNLVSNYRKSQFKNWLAAYNKKYNVSIPYIESKAEVSFSNAWLSGFIDAEGCFSGRVKLNTFKKECVLTEFSISQKDQSILVLIRALFNIVSTNLRFDPSWDGYQFHLCNKKKLLPLIAYLKTYPLKTIKSMAFKKFCVIHEMCLTKKLHKTEKGLSFIKNLCIDFNLNKEFRSKKS